MTDQVAGLPSRKMAILDSYFQSSHVVDQLVDLPPRNGNLRFILIDSYCGRSQVADIPPIKWQFYITTVIDSYSESSHVADQVVDITPPTNGNFIFLSYRFLL